MTRLRRVSRALVAAAALCLAAGLLLPGHADAAQSGLVQLSVNGAAFTSTPTGPLLDIDGLAPGASTSAQVGVRSGMDSAAALLVRLTDVSDDDNGCTAPEARVDATCGTGGGELGGETVVDLDVATTSGGTATRVWSGTAAQLAAGVATAVSVPAGADRWLTLTATLPSSAGNDVQSDTFDFLTRVELTTTSGVAGVTVTRPGAAVSPTTSSRGWGPLSYTGVSLILLVVGGVLLLAAGGISLFGSTRRRPG